MARAVRSGSRADPLVLGACIVVAWLITMLPSDLRDSFAGLFRRSAMAPLIQLQSRAERARRAFALHDQTSMHVDSLALNRVRLADLEQENNRLRRLLGLGAALKWGFVPAEALHVRALGDENSVLLTVGSAAGVVPRSAVVAPDGLVGIVTVVDPRTSQAILWTHPEFRASAMAADGSAFGIIRPHVGDDPEHYLLELQGVAVRQVLKPGTLIRSSGLGGVIPRGIPIGVVLGEAKTSEVWSHTYLVRPTVKPPDISSVMVLLPGRGQGDLTSVWTAEAADSAVRRVVAGADSIGRPAAHDSVRRDTTRIRP